jgi:FMN-dependent NADH-azoreductase
MNTILHIDSSIFGEAGQSSRLAAQFVARVPGARVLRRDLSKQPLQHLDAERFGAFLSRPESRTPAQQRVLDESDAPIAEGLAIGEAQNAASLAAADRALRELAQTQRIAA